MTKFSLKIFSYKSRSTYSSPPTLETKYSWNIAESKEFNIFSKNPLQKQT